MNSIPRALLFAFLIIFSIQLISLPLASAQSNSRKIEPTKSSSDNDYSQEAVVLEQLKTAYRFEKDGTGTHELTFRAKVQNEAAVERFGQLIFPYISANEKLNIDFVRVRKPDGSVVAASSGDVQDLTAPVSREAPVYTDVRQKHITVPGLRPGDTLEYHLVWQMHTPLAPENFWMTYDSR
jgi:hypothetical protein